MSSYLDRIQTDLVAAMKAKDELRLSVLRMTKSALKLKEVDKMAPLTDLEGFWRLFAARAMADVDTAPSERDLGDLLAQRAI